MMSLEAPTSTDFSSHLNQPFKLEVESLPPILLKLSAVRGINQAEHEREYTTTHQFVVVFHGPLRPLLPKQIYCLQHPTMGKLKLLFVPVGPSGGSMQYQATLVA
ncbi:MAG: hypothetical protein KF832_04370 [Caldilineaceae bacterium]|nr:hypothetical protein [Caldilineaceae bacterium]